MNRRLTGHLILIAEDEPLIALDITQAFEHEGARVIKARTRKEALGAVDDPNLSAAILDHGLGDSDSSTVCERLKERNIPFITYTGYDHLCGVRREGTLITKPASMSVLTEAVNTLLTK